MLSFRHVSRLQPPSRTPAHLGRVRDEAGRSGPVPRAARAAVDAPLSQLVRL